MPAAPQLRTLTQVQLPPDQLTQAQHERTRLLADAASAASTNSSNNSSNSAPSTRLAFESASTEAAAAARRRSAADKESARWMRLTILLCILFLSAGLATYLDAHQLQLLIESLKDAKMASMLVFTVLFGAAVVLLVPGMLLSIGSGAAFGVMSGSVVAWLGTVLGQVGAFLLGRYLLRDVVVGYMEKRMPHFKAVDAGISEDGWRLVLLLRLSPVLPYNLMNYALGVTAIKLVPYAVSSGVAALPYVCLFAYLGSVADDLYKLLHEGARAALSPQLLIILACVMILSAVGLFYVCRHVVVDVAPAHEQEASRLTSIEEGVAEDD